MTPNLVWPLGHQLRGWSPSLLLEGAGESWTGPGRELGPSLSCPPQTPSRDPPGLPHLAPVPNPSCFLLASPPIDAHPWRRRRKKPTRQRHQGEIYCKNCTKEPVCWPGLGLFLPGQGVKGCGSAGGDGAQAGGGSAVCTQSGGEYPVQRAGDHASPGPRRERQWRGAGQGGGCPP